MNQDKPHTSSKWIYALVILFVTAAVIIGAWRITADKPVAIQNPAEIYDSAVSKLNSKEQVYYRISGAKSFSIADSTITEEFVRNVVVQGLGTETPFISIDETLSIGDYDIILFDTYYDQKEYLTIQGVSFFAPMTLDSFTARQIPLLTIDSSLYANISGERTAKQSVITFQNAQAVEPWVSNTPTSLVSAYGTVYLDNAGNLTASEYTAEYTCERTTFHLRISVEILSDEVPEMITPDTSGFQEVSSITTPLQLEKACGYLLSAERISADYTDKIACQAFGDERIQAVHLETDNSNTFNALMDTKVTASNSSKAGVVSTTTKAEVFQDNIYSIATNGEGPIINAEVTLETMKGHCETQLIGTIVLPQYISTITHTDTDEVCYIAFNATEEFAQVLIDEACNTLYQTPAVLNNMADTYQTNAISAYITLDRVTGFPISSGFNYLGTFTISSLPYTLSFTAEQNYTLPIPPHS